MGRCRYFKLVSVFRYTSRFFQVGSVFVVGFQDTAISVRYCRYLRQRAPRDDPKAVKNVHTVASLISGGTLSAAANLQRQSRSSNYIYKNLCGRDGRTICGPQRVPKSTCVSL